MRCVQISYVLASISNTSTQRCHLAENVKNSGNEGHVKAATSAAFAVSVGEKFIIKKKRGDPVVKVTDDGRGQLGHMQRDLVPVLACFPVLIVNLSILNHQNNKYFS